MLSQIFIPLGQLVADVVGEQQKVGLHHFPAVGELYLTLAVEHGGIGQIYFGISAQIVVIEDIDTACEKGLH